jgi:hypothetical protein
MRVETIPLYHIDPKDKEAVEEAIQGDDEEAFTRLGPYFKEHKGETYLLNAEDIGITSATCAYLQERYDLQGGIEVTGTEEELHELECLLDSQDCLACRIANRILILPGQEVYVQLVECLKQQAHGAKHHFSLLAATLQITRHVLCFRRKVFG